VSFRYDGDLQILRKPQDLRNQTLASKKTRGSVARARKKDLADVFAVREIYQGGSGLLRLQDSCFDVKAPGKVEVTFHRFAIALRQVLKIPRFGNKDGETLGAKIVGHSSAATDQHRCRRFG